jgi:chemotaxis methyl-accepting protein methylase/chemotaxis receptor (MCP) glutamine deamidase CheD
MRRVRLTITSENFRRHDAVRIQQGETWVGPEVQGTILKSCMCIGFYHAERRVGAISHITDFHQQGGHHVAGALEALEKGLRDHGLKFSDCSCFILGGATRARHVYDGVVAELTRRGIAFDELDVLDNFHRKFIFDPGTGELLLLKKSQEEAVADSRSMYSSDRSFQCFHDPKRRLITGASLFFRNEQLIGFLQNTILPGLLERGKRLHVWCAGCSNGMEVYSTAMLILEYLDRKGLTGVDFRILGSDISAEALEMARTGLYPLSERAQETYQDLFRKYMERPDTNQVLAGSRLRKHVVFVQRDIREGSRQHKFDLVICDHVMQYFSADIQTEMLAPLVRALLPGGFAYISSPSPIVREQIERTYNYRTLGRHLYKSAG